MADVAPKVVRDVQPIGDASVTPFWRVPWEFAVHGIIGTAIFAIIAGLAVALDLSVGWLETYRVNTHRVSELIINGLKVAEYWLFATDLSLFAVFLWRTAKRTIKDL
jgi:hypothetical protein